MANYLLFIFCILFFLCSNVFSCPSHHPMANHSPHPSKHNEVRSMNLKIVQIGDPVLRNEARMLSKEEIISPRIQQLIDLMKTTMRDAPGVGLAAPQVGLSLQLAVIEDREAYLQGLTSEEIEKKDRHEIPFHVIINPKLTILETDQYADFYEGCLSLAGFVGNVPRALSVKVECLNEKGEPVTIKAKGWYARILQHEIDHLHGTLYIDRMTAQSLSTVENYKKFSSY